jgi:hypothetical protein
LSIIKISFEKNCLVLSRMLAARKQYIGIREMKVTPFSKLH